MKELLKGATLVLSSTAHTEASARNAQTTHLLVELGDGVLSTVLEASHFY